MCLNVERQVYTRCGLATSFCVPATDHEYLSLSLFLLSGFGDGKYVSFEERQWHQSCFKCSGCSVSLVGAGFFPNGSNILCKDCNN